MIEEAVTSASLTVVVAALSAVNVPVLNTATPVPPFAIASVPVRTNKTERPSRLFKSVPRFILHTGVTMARAYTTHNPMRAFVGAGVVIAVLGLLPILRFLLFYLSGDGEGHIQSLVIGGSLLVLGILVAIMGMLADLIGANRKLLEVGLVRIRMIEDRIDALGEGAETAKPAARTAPAKVKDAA